jgi:hypothetical protein
MSFRPPLPRPKPRKAAKPVGAPKAGPTLTAKTAPKPTSRKCG